MTPESATQTSKPDLLGGCTEHVAVLIVGGGPVGLGTALELARHGLRALLVERHDSTTHHPKTRNLNTRTMEIVRGWGSTVYDEIVGVNLPPGWTEQIVYTRTLAGEELGRMPTAGFAGPGPDVSQEVPILSSQDVFEPILRRAAEATGLAELRFGHEVNEVERGMLPGDDGVVVSVTERATGRRYRVAAEYLVAADGASSPTRAQLGIEMEGLRGIGHFVNVYYRANLDRWVAHRPAILYWVAGDSVRGVFQPLDARGRWLCQIAYDGSSDSFAAYDERRCVEWLRSAVGDPSLAPEILSIGSWTMNAVVAQRLKQARVLLVGDAAHQLPPTGGFGMNTGIQTAHNLVWKLALVLAGAAGPALLDTFEQERRPVGRFNADRSLENAMMVQRINAAATGEIPALTPAEAVEASRRYGNFLGMELGFHYDSAAVVPDGTEPPRVGDPVIDYVPCARPGHRAPHLWLERGGGRVSTLDLLGPGFTLLAGARGETWVAAAHEAAQRLGVRVDAHAVGAHGGLMDADGAFGGLYGIEASGAVLVRPDGHVAFRAQRAAADPARELSDALGRVLDCRPPPVGRRKTPRSS
jgi:2-polyprenyl-6-methoxyphenol hydroxylase-like FAD-dependent oxidoreductase